MCTDIEDDRPSPNDTLVSRQIGGGFFSEWGHFDRYSRYGYHYFAQGEVVMGSRRFMHIVDTSDGRIYRSAYGWAHRMLCVYP